jgi:UDP-N-acetylmuramoyl-tripeptide--D-alanyl-D-alanine ligase
MIKLSLKELVQVTHGELINKFTSAPTMKGISTDSRTLKRGNLFVTLKGEEHDGHEFIPEALGAGASCVLVRKDKAKDIDQKLKEKIALVAVDDTLRTLQDLAFWHRRKFDVKTVAITGSNGKTTTKDMVASVLSQKYKVIKSPRSFNTQVGVPLTLFDLDEHVEVLVVELGASMLGEIQRLTQISQPDIGVITNVSIAHLEFFESFENIVQAKFELLENMPEDKIAVLNSDDESLSVRVKKEKRRVVTFGIEKKAEFWAQEVSFTDKGEVNFVLNEKLPVQLKLIGRHNVYNALAALAVGTLLEIPSEKMTQILEDFTPPELRMRLLVFDGIRVINDSYNANPASVENALKTLNQMKASGRKIAVLGDMLELGKRSENFHKEAGNKVFDYGVDILVTVGNLSKFIAQGAKEKGLKNSSVISFDDKKNAIEYLCQNLKEGDLILVKGSRKMKLEDLVESLKRAYVNQS